MRWLLDFIARWASVASGGFSMVFVVLAAAGEAVGWADWLKASFWVSAYFFTVLTCFTYTADLRSQLRTVREQLESRGLTEARLAEARVQLGRLTDDHRNTLRLLLNVIQMTGNQAAAWVSSGAGCLNFMRTNTPFLNHDNITGLWTIHPQWHLVLNELLCATNGNLPPVSRMSALCGWLLELPAFAHAVYREVLERSSRIREERRPRAGDHQSHTLGQPGSNP